MPSWRKTRIRLRYAHRMGVELSGGLPLTSLWAASGQPQRSQQVMDVSRRNAHRGYPVIEGLSIRVAK